MPSNDQATGVSGGNPQGRYLYVFLHIPKTGGTTINHHLRGNLVYDEETIHLGGAGDIYRNSHDRPPFEERSVLERSRARVISGHRVRYGDHALVPDSDPRYFTILRDPADRIVSTYNFQMASRHDTNQSFEVWYGDWPRNRTFRWLRRRLDSGSVPEMLDRLRSFWFVGVTEHLDEDLPRLFGALGVPREWTDLRVTADADSPTSASHESQPFDINPGKKSQRITRQVSVTPELRERIYNDHPRDLRLYRFALRRREKMRWD